MERAREERERKRALLQEEERLKSKLEVREGAVASVGMVMLAAGVRLSGLQGNDKNSTLTIHITNCTCAQNTYKITLVHTAYENS